VLSRITATMAELIPQVEALHAQGRAASSIEPTESTEQKTV